MKLLELFLEYSVCPVCGNETRPVLTVDNWVRSDYTLEMYRYPLVFKKRLEFGSEPLSYTIQDSAERDTIKISNTDVFVDVDFRAAQINSYCPYNHYNCVFWRGGPYPKMDTIAIYPRLNETIRIGKYKVTNIINGTQSSTTITSSDDPFSYGAKHILSFKTLVPNENWHFHDLKTFENKLNKLILLK